MNSENLQQLQNLLKLVQNGVGKAEFLAAFKNIMDIVTKLQKDIVDRNQKINASLVEMFGKLSEKLSTSSDSEMKSMKDTIDSEIRKALKEQSNGLNFIRDKVRKIKEGNDGKNGLDGKSPTQEELIALITPLIPKPIEPTEETPQETRDKLLKLKGEERLGTSAIKGLDEELKNMDTRFKNIPRGSGTVGWGAHPLVIQDTGSTKVKVARVINFTGASVSQSFDGITTVAISGGGSGFQSPLSGGLTGTNTWTTAPKVIVVDGVPLQKTRTDGTVNWTGTTTTVLTIAPQYDVFASA